MIFSLEILQAHHGDALLLHYGKTTSPKLIVVDGGPKDIYSLSLKPRLEEIRENLDPSTTLRIEMVMVSHLDDDHINGVCELFADTVEQNQPGQTAAFKLKNLWVNTFDDIIGNVPASGNCIYCCIVRSRINFLSEYA
ncbi:MAG: hypothetical protein WDO19_30220 [Bacteroidota bacterium]